MINKINLGKKKLIIIFSIVIFLFAFFIRIFYISQKSGIHIDEGYSNVIPCFIKYQWHKHFEEGKIYTGKELKNIVFSNNSNLKEAMEDIMALRYNNNNTKDHTTLYHTIYLLWTQGNDGVLTPEEFVNKACSLNLIFFIFSFFIMYKILQIMFPDSFVIIAGLAAAFLTTGSISNTLMIRPYQMQELSFVLIAYVFIKNFLMIKQNENIITLKNFYLTSFSLTFTILTGYFAGIYIVLLGTTLIFLCLKNKMYKNLLFLFMCLAQAIMLSILFYPGFLKGFKCFRTNQVIELLIITDIKILKDILCINLKHYFNIITGYLLYIPLFFIIITTVFQKKRKYDKLPLILIGTSFMYSLAIIYIAPFKVIRYIAAAFPMISIIIPMMLYSTKNLYLKILTILTVLIILINACAPYSTIGYDWSPQYSDGNYFRAKIENINDTEYEQSKFIKKPELPVIIVNDPYWCSCLNLIFNMPDSQKYEFTDDVKNIPDKYNHYFLLVEKTFEQSEARKFNLPKNSEIVDTFTPARFDGYEIVKK